jgi:hypothetical protein
MQVYFNAQCALKQANDEISLILFWRLGCEKRGGLLTSQGLSDVIAQYMAISG